MRSSYLLFIGLLLSISLVAGCSGNGGSSSGDDDPPLEEQKISGVWLGWLDETFVMGIVTEENEVRLISDSYQCAGPEGAWSVTPPAALSGSLSRYTWDAARTDCSVTGSILDFVGWVAGEAYLWGSYRDNDTDDSLPFNMIYNTTYTEQPDIRNLEGTWKIQNLIETANTGTLVIAPDVQDASRGTIDGEDELGNRLTGTIEIHYTPNAGREFNVYDVDLVLNGTDSLSGLAAYVLEMNTQGIEVKGKTLAIGATDGAGTKSFSGLARQSSP